MYIYHYNNIIIILYIPKINNIYLNCVSLVPLEFDDIIYPVYLQYACSIYTDFDTRPTPVVHPCKSPSKNKLHNKDQSIKGIARRLCAPSAFFLAPRVRSTAINLSIFHNETNTVGTVYSSGRTATDHP